MQNESSNCPKCNSLLLDGQNFCPDCGSKVREHTSTNRFEDGAQCDQCGADLVTNQKFCGGCGIEMDWSSDNFSSFDDETSLDKTKSVFLGKDEIIGAVGLIVFIAVLVFIFWPNQGNKQEECFQSEMNKLGSIVQPKDWVIRSRLYCQSLYP